VEEQAAGALLLVELRRQPVGRSTFHGLGQTKRDGADLVKGGYRFEGHNGVISTRSRCHQVRYKAGFGHNVMGQVGRKSGVVDTTIPRVEVDDHAVGLFEMAHSREPDMRRYRALVGHVNKRGRVVADWVRHGPANLRYGHPMNPLRKMRGNGLLVY